MKHLFIFAISLFLLFSACDKPPGIAPINIIPDSTNGGIFIINEGVFMQGNAELSFINSGLNKRYDNVFFQANNRNLGDVFQSMNIFNGNAYLVVNNSSKIEIINPFTFKSVGTVTQLKSPRYLLKTGINKAYISDIYDNHVFVIDLNTNTVIKKIPLQGWSEEMCSFNGKTYVTNMRTSYLAIIDENNDNIIDSIKTPFAPKNILQDSAKNIWVLCGDINATDKRHFIVKIDPFLNKIVKTVEVKKLLSTANRLKINKAGNTLFWIDEEVYKMSLSDTMYLPQMLIDNEKKVFYGLGLDPKTNEIYVSDVKDFNSKSDIYRYNTNGQLLGKFEAGKNTNDFYFFNP